MFTRIPGKMIPFWRAYFSKGLVQPPTSFVVYPVEMYQFWWWWASILGGKPLRIAPRHLTVFSHWNSRWWFFRYHQKIHLDSRVCFRGIWDNWRYLTKTLLNLCWNGFTQMVTSLRISEWTLQKRRGLTLYYAGFFDKTPSPPASDLRSLLFLGLMFLFYPRIPKNPPMEGWPNQYDGFGVFWGSQNR